MFKFNVKLSEELVKSQRYRLDNLKLSKLALAQKANKLINEINEKFI